MYPNPSQSQCFLPSEKNPLPLSRKFAACRLNVVVISSFLVSFKPSPLDLPDPECTNPPRLRVNQYLGRFTPLSLLSPPAILFPPFSLSVSLSSPVLPPPSVLRFPKPLSRQTFQPLTFLSLYSGNVGTHKPVNSPTPTSKKNALQNPSVHCDPLESSGTAWTGVSSSVGRLEFLGERCQHVRSLLWPLSAVHRREILTCHTSVLTTVM